MENELKTKMESRVLLTSGLKPLVLQGQLMLDHVIAITVVDMASHVQLRDKLI